MSNLDCPSSLTRADLKEFKKQFPKILKSKKSAKDYLLALRNYDYVVAELYCTRNKLAEYRKNLQELSKFNDQKMQKILAYNNNLKIMKNTI